MKGFFVWLVGWVFTFAPLKTSTAQPVLISSAEIFKGLVIIQTWLGGKKKMNQADKNKDKIVNKDEKKKKDCSQRKMQ